MSPENKEITINEYLEELQKLPEEQNFELIKNYNKELLTKYPWLAPYKEFKEVEVLSKTERFFGNSDEIPKYDYSFTKLDEMPSGWRIAFGEQLCNEIHQELVKFDLLGSFEVLEIKEKFGSLRFYTSNTPVGKLEFYGDFYLPKTLDDNNTPVQTETDYYEYADTASDGTKHYKHFVIKEKCKIQDIIKKYSTLSSKMCIMCGATAKWLSKGWVAPYCNECKKDVEEKRKFDFVPI